MKLSSAARFALVSIFFDSRSRIGIVSAGALHFRLKLVEAVSQFTASTDLVSTAPMRSLTRLGQFGDRPIDDLDRVGRIASVFQFERRECLVIFKPLV